MIHVKSNDGTPIALYTSGEGPSLLLVHGTGSSNPAAAWVTAVSALEPHFRICSIDRRGRGGSGDAPDYAVEREAEDVAAVIDAIGEPVHLLGHSFGGVVALEAALLTDRIRRLVLYEPSISTPAAPVEDPGLTEQLRTLLEAGDREGVLLTFYEQVANLSPEDIEGIRASPVWAARLAAAHTLFREMEAEEEYRVDAQRLRDLPVPTLLLLGGDSPLYYQAAIEMLHEILPDSRIRVMPGQQHVAMYTAPSVFADELIAFLLGGGDG